MHLFKKVLMAATFFLSIAACKSPEERATGEEGGSRDDSMKNTQPMTDPYAKPNSADSTQMRDNTDTGRLNDSSGQ